jgi:hypothetical protein
MNSDVRTELKVATVGLACACAPLAFVSVPIHEPVHLAMTWLFLVLGPIGGWIQAATYGHAFPSALQLLIPATLACVVPAGIYTLRRDAEWLVLSFLAWVTSGYLFTVALWT